MNSYYQKVINLSFGLAKANFKLRTEGSYLGVLWYLLDPLLMFLVFYLIFSKNIGLEISYYPLYLLAGLITFNFFSSVTAEATSIINLNSHFIKSIKIPIEALVFALLLKNLLSHFFEIIIFCFFLIYFKITIFGALLYLPVLLAFFLFTAGTCFVLATLGVYANDLNNIWRFISQLLFFASAIFYKFDSEMLILKYNPVALLINAARKTLVYGQWPSELYALSIISFVVFGFGLMLFSKSKYGFAEKI